jgi:hypothetical protein
MSSSCATYDDVNLMLRLYELRREERLRDARRWYAKDFKAKTLAEVDKLCPPGSVENESYRMVTSYWEMVASFVAAGVLSKAVFFESGRELLFAYERVRAILPAIRERFHDPRYLRNMETVAEDDIAWYEEQAPGAHEAFAVRIGAR